jgi:hypothetical protein
MTIDRRAMLGATARAALAGGAVVNLTAIVAAKADLSPRGEKSDPIFDLIERHKALYDAVEASAFEERDRLDAEVDKVNEVRDAILAAPFTTPAGMAAMIRFLIEYELEAYDYTEHGGAFLRRLADALDRQAVLS